MSCCNREWHDEVLLVGEDTRLAELAAICLYLADRFSAADVMVGSSCVFLRMFGMLPESPAIEAYADRCLARPAYARAMEMEADTAD